MEREIIYKEEDFLTFKKASKIMTTEGVIILKDENEVIGAIINKDGEYIVDLADDQVCFDNLESALDFAVPYTPYLITR